MPLFDVAAWSVPEQLAESSKKRKRDVKPSVNLDKLVRKLKGNTSARPNKAQIALPRRLQATKSKPAEEYQVPSPHPRKRGNSELEDADSLQSRPKKRVKRDKPQYDSDSEPGRHVRFGSHIPDTSLQTKKRLSSILTPLQSGMKAQLEGARFR